MGYFGTWLLEGGTWSSAEVPAHGDTSARWLHIEIHDSDYAAIRYSPVNGGNGVAYVGMTPRVYFEDEAASAPTDVTAESSAIATWVADTVGGDPSRLRKIAAGYLADDSEPDWESILPLDGSVSSIPDEDVFVEQRIARFLDEMGIGLPDNYWE